MQALFDDNGFLLRPCEVLIQHNAQIDWAEKQIEYEAEKAAKACNAMIASGVNPDFVRRDFTEYMEKVKNHYLPAYMNTPIPHIQFVFSCPDL